MKSARVLFAVLCALVCARAAELMPGPGGIAVHSERDVNRIALRLAEQVDPQLAAAEHDQNMVKGLIRSEYTRTHKRAHKRTHRRTHRRAHKQSREQRLVHLAHFLNNAMRKMYGRMRRNDRIARFIAHAQHRVIRRQKAILAGKKPTTPLFGERSLKRKNAKKHSKKHAKKNATKKASNKSKDIAQKTKKSANDLLQGTKNTFSKHLGKKHNKRHNKKHTKRHNRIITSSSSQMTYTPRVKKVDNKTWGGWFKSWMPFTTNEQDIDANDQLTQQYLASNKAATSIAFDENGPYIRATDN